MTILVSNNAGAAAWPFPLSLTTLPILQTTKVTKLVQLEQKCNKQQLLLLLDPFNGLFSSLDLNEARDDGVLGW